MTSQFAVFMPLANPIIDVLSPIIEALDWALRTFYFDLGIPWGLGIILLTFIVRTLLLPLTYKQITSMLHMQQFQPQIKELNEKYKDDPKRKQEELMKFFKTHGINPLASCFPLLLQLPFFIAMFYALRDPTLMKEIAANDPSFLFIPSLVAKPSGLVLVALLVLYVGSQLGATVVSLATATDEMQRRLMLALPFLFVPFVINFQSGLILYWITTNFWTLGQAFVVKHLRTRRDEANALADGTVVGSDAVAAASLPKKAPPPPPRQKRKRSGRRR